MSGCGIKVPADTSLGTFAIYLGHKNLGEKLRLPLEPTLITPVLPNISR